MFMKHPQIIAGRNRQRARLIAGPDNRVLYTQGNRVYAYGLTEPGRYLTYRVNKTSPTRKPANFSAKKLCSAASPTRCLTPTPP